ncbi:MAG TPA: adenosine deaminase, partial [Candidatus Dormibacteraeota bacterium]|nr:adenosine deaminase [Candidatus Dormibacteraeota bacterium]
MAMNEAFQLALRAEDLDAIRSCPKSDLHNHGWAGADSASVAAILGRTYAPLDRKLTSIDEMHAWVG